MVSGLYLEMNMLKSYKIFISVMLVLLLLMSLWLSQTAQAATQY